MPGASRPFIEGGGAQTYPQPYRIEGADFYAFLLAADAKALVAVCDRYLNPLARDGMRYHPLVGRVMLGITDIRKIQIGARDDRKFWTPEIDVAFWVPVVAVHRVAGVDVVSRFAWMMTYVVVDDTWAVASGREVYGFPKALGVIRRQAAARGPGAQVALDSLTVDTLAVAKFGPDAEAHVQRLLEVRRVGAGSPGAPARAWVTLREAAADFFALLSGGGSGRLTLPGPGLLVELFDLLRHHEYPLVFLKQFRDAADGTQACYQAVVEAPVRITSFRGGGWLDGEYRLRIEPLESHPIAQELGLAGPEPRILAATYMAFDFDIGDGRVIWEN